MKNSKKLLILILALVLTFSLTLAGCTQDAGEDVENDADEEAAAGEEAAGEEEAAEPKTLVFARSGDSVGLDPANVTDGESLYVTGSILDTLLAYDMDNTNVVPALATEWKTVDEENKVWELKLREGVKFHDGTDFNAEAVKFNFERWMNEDNEYRYPGENYEYYSYMFNGFPGVIDEVVVVDEYTVQIVLNTPSAPFLNNIAMAPFAIMSPEAIKTHGEDIFKNPVGTGPFKFVEWVKDDKIILEKNDEYWGEEAKLDQIIFRSIPDNSARLLELQSGSIDMMIGVSPDDAQIVEDDPELDLYLRPSMNIGYFSLNMNKEPFDNIKVRKAINYAVDKQGIIDAFYGGLAESAKNPLPPSLWGYNDEIEPYEYNPEKAKELLAEAGYEDGFSMTLWAMPVARPYMPQPKEIATALQQQFAAVNIDSEIVTMDWATYLDKTREGEHDTCLLGWTGDNGDPDNFITVLLHSESSGNVSFYKNEEVDSKLMEAQSNPNKEERIALYKEVQQIIHDDAPWVPLVHSTPPIAAKKTVTGFVPHPTGSETTFWNVDIEQ